MHGLKRLGIRELNIRQLRSMAMDGENGLWRTYIYAEGEALPELLNISNNNCTILPTQPTRSTLNSQFRLQENHSSNHARHLPLRNHRRLERSRFGNSPLPTQRQSQGQRVLQRRLVSQTHSPIPIRPPIVLQFNPPSNTTN
jgi:hypothetical protein